MRIRLVGLIAIAVLFATIVLNVNSTKAISPTPIAAATVQANFDTCKVAAFLILRNVWVEHGVFESTSGWWRLNVGKAFVGFDYNRNGHLFYVSVPKVLLWSRLTN